MAINLADYERKARDSVKAFWGNREAARQKQIEAGKTDQGERAAVTAGKNMDGFIALMIDLVEANGLQDALIMRDQSGTDPARIFSPDEALGPPCPAQGAVLSPRLNSNPRWGRHSATILTTGRKKLSEQRMTSGPPTVKARLAIRRDRS